MANQELITLVYDCIDFVDDQGCYISFGDDIGVYIQDSLSEIDDRNMTIEVPLWFVIAKELEMYEE